MSQPESSDPWAGLRDEWIQAYDSAARGEGPNRGTFPGFRRAREAGMTAEVINITDHMDAIRGETSPQARASITAIQHKYELDRETARLLWHHRNDTHVRFNTEEQTRLCEALEPRLAAEEADRIIAARTSATPAPTGATGAQSAAPQATPGSLDEWDAGDDPGKIPPREWLLANQFCRSFISSIVEGALTPPSIAPSPSARLQLRRTRWFRTIQACPKDLPVPSGAS
jgi:hypothetical protein